MASTTKDTPVRIANKYEDNWGLSDSEIELIKTEFNEKLHDHYRSTRSSEANSIKSQNCLDPLLLSIKIEEEKSRQDSSYINNYRDKYKIVESTDGKERLLLKGEDGKYKVFLPWEDIFDIFWKTHLKYCHPTSETLKHILQDDYIINDFAIQNISEVCYTCSGIKKPYYRLALDILKMTGSPDFAFTHIMTCQDMFTGFIHLRPLSADTKESEICVELLRIFMDFGPPKEVVISSNIFEVALDQIKHLTTFAPIKIAITKVNPDIEKLNRLRNRITVWMTKNNFENWGIACYAVQLDWNNESKGLRKKSPFANVFKKIESCVIEVLPEMDVRIDKVVSTSTTSPVDLTAVSFSGRESAEQASPGGTSSSEEFITDEIIAGTETEFITDETNAGTETEFITDEIIAGTETEFITDEIIAGTETEFKATSDDEMMQCEDNDPLAIDETIL